MSQLPDDAWQTYKRLLSYVKPHALILFASVIGYAIYAATQAGAAQLAGYLGETVVNPEPHRVVIVSIAPFFIALAQGLGQFMGSYSMTWVAQEIVYRLRNDVFGHVLRLPQAEYNNNASGRIMSKIIFDAQQITSAGTDALIVMLREGLTVIGLLTFLLYQNWKLTLILLIAAPLVGLVVNLTSKRFRNISRRIQGSMGNITQFLGEAIEGNQAVKIFGGQKLEADRFHSVSRRFARQNTKLNASKIGSTVIVQLFVSVAIGAVTYLYITMMGEALTVGGFLSYIAAAGMIPTANILSVYALIAHADAPHGPKPNPFVALFKNPIVLACIVGLALAGASITLPRLLDDSLRILGDAALALGLLSAGAGVDLSALRRAGPRTLSWSLVRLLGLPAFAVGFCILLGVTGTPLVIALICAATPTATSSYILAKELGGDAALSANLIAVETVLAMITLPALYLLLTL